jgi:hypothetical protein
MLRRSSEEGRQGKPQQRKFPVDRLALRLYQRSWPMIIGQSALVAQGGDVRLVFSPNSLPGDLAAAPGLVVPSAPGRFEIDVGNVPKGTARTTSFLVTNRGSVTVRLGVNVRDRAVEDECFKAMADFGAITVRPEKQPLVLNPSEAAKVVVRVNVKKRGALSASFKLNLLGCALEPPRSWQFHVTGYGDSISLSDPMSTVLEQEELPYTQRVELAPDPHLLSVLAPVDQIGSISIHHQIAWVEPVVGHADIGAALSLPAPLAQSVLRTFKKWYYNRAPLRMARQKDNWEDLEDQTKHKTTVFATKEK